MEPTLHMQQGLTLLNRVLQFYPIMQEGNSSTVTLTEQDWMVLMDFVENPEARQVWPEGIRDMRVDRSTRVITIEPNDEVTVAVTMGW